MPSDTSTVTSSTSAESPRMAKLRHMVEHAAHLLPAQGPIRVFIHHNTLHALEDQPFDAAVRKGAELFDCEPYLTEQAYRQLLNHDRIRLSDLESVLREDLGSSAGATVAHLTARFDLRAAILQYPLLNAGPAELRWFIAETDALARFRNEADGKIQERLRDETRHWIMRDFRNGRTAHGRKSADHYDAALREQVHRVVADLGVVDIEDWSSEKWTEATLRLLWSICRTGVSAANGREVWQPRVVRLRDLLWQATGEDTDLPVHETLIRFCAAFLDQGLANWQLPHREKGFLRAFCELYRQPGSVPDRALRGLRVELERVCQENLSPWDLILESLDEIGAEESEWDEFLTVTLLALRGWAGMIWQLETRGDRVAHPAPPGSLVEFLAVRLLLDRLARAHVAEVQLGVRPPLADLRKALVMPTQPEADEWVERRAFEVFQLAQVCGWLPRTLAQLSAAEWTELLDEIAAFDELERRRIFHLAYELRYRTQTLDALKIRAERPIQRTDDPRWQVVTCIDEREESFRRHIEELDTEVETFGVAGFFNVVMYYRGVGDAHFTPLCPVVVRPQHWVTEEVAYTLGEVHRRRAKTRRALGAASHQIHVASRTLTVGALLAAGFGALASIPLVMRVLFPRLTSRLRHAAGGLLRPPTMTKLQLERTESPAGPTEGQLGFTVDEMTAIVERVLRDIGLTRRFSRMVMVLGHGSTSMNNPHESAHDCGACGGGVGGANARPAQMANDPRVRERLAARGLNVPAETIFLGGLHNTCDDSVTVFDLEHLPKSHHEDMTHVQQVLDSACDRNAHERSRRFELAPLSLSPAAARRHVEGRSQDLAETRPEFGHATNAVCVVGRRSRTHGLFMDRRAFLVSYDPTQDDGERTIFDALLQAVVPVCGGINLEYYFSYVDPVGWGCGTKLPHNITSLLGIMDGAASDLRPGLPWQMVEIHEPVRLLFVVETSPEAMLRIIDRNPAIGRMVRYGWVQLAVLSPMSSQIHVYRGGEFVPHELTAETLPVVSSSADWYRGWREHLSFALVDAVAAASTASAP